MRVHARWRVGRSGGVADSSVPLGESTGSPAVFLPAALSARNAAVRTVFADLRLGPSARVAEVGKIATTCFSPFGLSPFGRCSKRGMTCLWGFVSRKTGRSKSPKWTVQSSEAKLGNVSIRNTFGPICPILVGGGDSYCTTSGSLVGPEGVLSGVGTSAVGGHST